MLLFLSILTLLGLVIGSFLGVVISRLPQGLSIVHHRSHCSRCHKELRWYDLIPLFSYLSLQGKCRYCHSPIGRETFFIEIITAMLFVLTGITFYQKFSLITTSNSMILLVLQLLYSLYIVSTFIAIGFIDMRHNIIPNKIVYPATVVSLLYFMFFQQTLFFSHVLSGIGAFLFFLLLFLITKGRGMGFGDVKFVFLLGIFLGFPGVVVALYTAFLTGALIACILVLQKKKKFRGGMIPFGPFLVFGGLLSFLYGTFILQKLLQVL